MLLFKKKFLDAIRSGEKTQTIRLWSHCRMKAGQRSYIPGAGYIRVLLVEVVRLTDLTDEDAHPDGFASAAALRREIRSLYRSTEKHGRRAFRVAFQLLSAREQRTAILARKRSKPARHATVATSRKSPAQVRSGRSSHETGSRPKPKRRSTTG